MIRQSLTDNARHAFIFVSAGQGVGFQRRTRTGRGSVRRGPTMAPAMWLRLVRQGSVFSAYSSSTGATWTLLSSATISMSTNAYVGLAITSDVPQPGHNRQLHRPGDRIVNATFALVRWRRR